MFLWLARSCEGRAEKSRSATEGPLGAARRTFLRSAEVVRDRSAPREALGLRYG